MPTTTLETYRDFLKDSIRTRVDFSQTDQARGVPPPPIEKPVDPAALRISLLPPDQWTAIGQVDLLTAITRRISRRNFRPTPLTLEELAFLLWTTQGIKRQVNAAAAFRTVPSAGCRHAFETYLWVLRVTGLAPGCYRYLPVEHQLVFEFAEEQMAENITKASLGQAFTGRAAVTFIWTAIPYRMEWRYGVAAHKVIALDAGHVCQNLYLACEAIGAGTCAIAAYDQEHMDRLLRLDGREEFTVYLAPVGKIA
jgi:SagB-type dehydrogenase family enzyme